MIFYLGTHRPEWLAELSDVPLFVSTRVLRRRVRVGGGDLDRFAARTSWALDSGGFTELSLTGAWQTSPATYVGEVRRYAAEIGRLDWASPQDWMCEPAILARTGLDVVGHQRRTVDNFLELRGLAPELPFVPVLQGWEPDDYRRHIDQYLAAGVDLRTEPRVGLGTVCRRQGTKVLTALVTELAAGGISLHGFGVKTQGLRAAGHLFVSADSTAWSLRACWATHGKEPKLDGCTRRCCNHCLHFALRWRADLLASLENPSRCRVSTDRSGVRCGA